MKRSTHYIYMAIIVFLLIMNVSLYIGKTDDGYPSQHSHNDVKDVQEAADRPQIDINTATLSELCTLKGIGPVTAEHILSRREELGGRFTAEEDLISVDGIGDSKFEDIKEYIYVGTED